MFNKKDKKTIIGGILSIILIMLITTSPYLIKNHYTFITGFGYSLIILITMSFFVLIIPIFKNVVYYNYNDKIENIGRNFPRLILIFGLYITLITTISKASIYFFDAVISGGVLNFRREIITYILPSLFGILLFMIRIISLFKKKILKLLKQIYDKTDDIEKKDFSKLLPEFVKTFEKITTDFLIAILLLAFFASFIFDQFLEVFKGYTGIITNVALILTIIFILLEILLIIPNSKLIKIKLSNQKYNKDNDYKLSKKQKIIGSFILLILFTLGGYSMYQEYKTPQIIENIKYPGYIINLNLTNNTKNELYPSKPKNFQIDLNNTKEFYIKLLNINNKSYPETTKIKSLTESNLITTNGEFKNLKINVRSKLLNASLKRKENDFMNFTEYEYFYRTSEFEQYIFTILYEFNLTKIYATSEPKSKNFFASNYYNKILYSENTNYKVYIHIRQSFSALINTRDIYILTNNINLSNDIKQRIENFETTAGIYLQNTSINYTEAFTFRLT